jgi:hypothetical protein
MAEKSAEFGFNPTRLVRMVRQDGKLNGAKARGRNVSIRFALMGRKVGRRVID